MKSGGGGRCRAACAATVALITLSALLAACGGSSGEPAAAARAARLAARRLGDDPGQAALLALAADRLDPSVAAEMSMLTVALDGVGVERVFSDGGQPLSAAIRTLHLVVGVDRTGTIHVWRPSGALIGEAAMRAPPIALADSQSTLSLAAVDAQGRLSLIDLTDPTRPAVHYLRSRVSGGRPLALGFTGRAEGIAVVTNRGDVEEFDSTTGSSLAPWSLRTSAGDLPWSAGGAALPLRTASFDSEGSGADERLLVATADDAVARVELRSRRGQTVIPEGVAPGRIVSLAEAPYSGPIAAASTGGVTVLSGANADPKIVRGSFATGVAFDLEDHLWVADREGVHFEENLPPGQFRSFAGRTARTLSVGTGGVVAVDPGGAISLLGPQNSGLGVAETYETAVATFDPRGDLVTESGAPGYVYQLETQRPGHKIEEGHPVENPELRTFEPDPNWWSEEEEGGLYVDAAVADEEFVIAAGQDPTGQGVLLVWNARSGAPLHRLAITTGGAESLQPGVASDLVLLPGKHLVAAYSPVLRAIEIWSTETWKYVGSVPVGHLTSLQASPDESELLGLEVPEPEAEGGADDSAHSKLVFIDVSGHRVDHVVDVGSALAAAWSPDGDRIAVGDGEEAVRLLSADGRKRSGADISLPGEPVALAWRPDGLVLAVSLGDGVVLADPASGSVSPRLPRKPKQLIPRLEWSPDGRFLAAVAIEPVAEDEESYEPAAAQLWTLGSARMRRRMCQLAGSGIEAAEWQRLLGGGGTRPLCRTPRLRSPSPRPAQDLDATEPVLAYRSGNRLFVSDADGESALIARVKGDGYVPLDAIWAGGSLGWATEGEVGFLPADASRAQTWPCACAGAVPVGRSLLALENGSRRMVMFTPGSPLPQVIPISGHLGESTRLLGVLGGRAIVGASPNQATGAVRGYLDAVARDGTVHFLGWDWHGIPSAPAAESPRGDALLFTSSTPGSDCISLGVVGLARLGDDGRVQVSYPPTPFGEEERTVRSVLVHGDGAIEAALASASCPEGSDSQPTVASRYVLRGTGWAPTRDRGFDVQLKGSALATILRPRDFVEGGRLILRADSGQTTILAPRAEQVWMKP